MLYSSHKSFLFTEAWTHGPERSTLMFWAKCFTTQLSRHPKKISLTSSSSYRNVWHFSIFMEYKIKHKQTAFCRCLIHGPFYKANMTVIRLYLIKYEPRVSLKVFTIRASRLWTLANYSAIKGGKNILATSFLFVTSVFLTNGWP